MLNKWCTYILFNVLKVNTFRMCRKSRSGDYVFFGNLDMLGMCEHGPEYSVDFIWNVQL